MTDVRPGAAPTYLLSRRSRRPISAFSWLRVVGFLLTIPLAGIVALSAIDYRHPDSSRPVVAVLGACVLWWWTIGRGGPVDRLRWRWAARRVDAKPREPWLADHRWNKDEAGLHDASPLRRQFGCIHAFVPLGIIVGIGWAPPLMLAALGLWLTLWIWAAWRAFCRGRGRVTFTRFPYFTGEPAAFHFGVTEGGPTFVHVDFVLERVEEVHRPWYAGGPWCRTTCRLEPAPTIDIMPGPGADVRLVFELPAHAGGTSLSAPLPTYWELQVAGDTDRGFLHERFLVPVYEKLASWMGGASS